MQGKGFSFGTEAATGLGLVVAGLAAHALGEHGAFALALAPFGIGLILSDMAGRLLRRRRD